jgi:hypothetical protein
MAKAPPAEPPLAQPPSAHATSSAAAIAARDTARLVLSRFADASLMSPSDIVKTC